MRRHPARPGGRGGRDGNAIAMLVQNIAQRRPQESWPTMKLIERPEVSVIRRIDDISAGTIQAIYAKDIRE